MKPLFCYADHVKCLKRWGDFVKLRHLQITSIGVADGNASITLQHKHLRGRNVFLIVISYFQLFSCCNIPCILNYVKNALQNLQNINWHKISCYALFRIVIGLCHKHQINLKNITSMFLNIGARSLIAYRHPLKLMA